MKKIVIIFAFAFLAAGALCAQGWGRNIPEPVKIEGTLQLHRGQFAVASGNNIYYVPSIGRYVGFIDSLKEGSNVSFDGYVFGNLLRPVKMTISGKSYDLAGGPGFGDLDNRRGNGFGPASGCCGQGFGWNGGNRPRDDFRGRRGW
jgi:hypothetical protein